MEGRKSDFVNKTVLTTPKPTASSTVDRKSFQRKAPANSDTNFENSLGIIDEQSLLAVSSQLQHQRYLASNSLQRANKVAAIPSKYLKRNISESDSVAIESNESTVSDSDLLKTPVNTSTPRNSIDRLSLSQSLAELSLKISNKDISLDKFVSDFKQAMKGTDCDIPNSMFTPAEEAESMLRADELSWRLKNDLPGQVEQFSQMDLSGGKVSVGEFFKKRSDTLSDFSAAKSPVKTKKPVPLINESEIYEEDEESVVDDISHKSLSISAIQQFLAQSEDTPRRAVDQLLKQGKKSDISLKSGDISIPVSKNSSYTSSCSDNEAIFCIVDKENVNTLNVTPKDPHPLSPTSPSSSTTSSRASSALTSLQNGKLPIETTKCDMIWGCLKIGKSETKDFLIRNRSSKRLGLKLSLSGQEFKIRKDNRLDSEPISSSKIILHPHEAKVLFVSFIPTKVGAAADELIFTSLDPNLVQTKKQCIRLFGYGGTGKVEFRNLTRDTTGKFWLPLGKLENQSVMTRSFNVRGSGVLSTFVHISFTSKDLAKVSIVPDFFLLIPNEHKEVVVSYEFSSEDNKSLHKALVNTNIVELGSLSVTSGTEVDRGRLRRLYRKCCESGLSIDPLATTLKKELFGEVMPSDLVRLKESSEYWREIFKQFSRNEIVITIERDPDQTIIPQFSDESGLYQSLWQDSTVVVSDHTVVQQCRLEPPTIFLTPPSKTKDYLFFISDSNKKLHYQVTCDPKGLELEPKEGIIVPGEQIVISLAYPKAVVNGNKQYKVSVYVENDVFEADVKVMAISIGKNKNSS
ncbi:uncharacterized protein [Leptinotarsa decemlineata]|uniref:uncharacterized protein n=1 Tax=Leptinotarsa decemlineata TaxID=7539 RepID=UPI003D30889F